MYSDEYHCLPIFAYNKTPRDMVKSKISVGQMFVCFPKPISDDAETPMPRVWVKVANSTVDGEEISLFVDNQALVRISIDRNARIGINEKWHITDRYYDYNVGRGDFVPISDLNELDGICEERGCPYYEVEL